MPSKLQGENTIKSFPGLFQEPFLPFGSTTLDFIIHEKANIRLIKALRKKFAMLFNLPLDKKWIVYAPTFRHTTSVNFSFRSLPIDKSNRLYEILTKNNAIIIEKLHPDSTNIDTARNNCGKMAPQLIEYEIGDACNQYLNFISHMLISD